MKAPPKTAIASTLIGLALPLATCWANVTLKSTTMEPFVSPRASETPAQAAELIEDSLELRYGGKWTARGWSPRTQAASIVYGTGLQVDPSSLATDSGAEATARELLADNPEIFSSEELALRAVKRKGGKTAVHFRQESDGLEVIGGRAYVIFGPAGEMMAMGSELYDPSARVEDASRARFEAESSVQALVPGEVSFTSGRLVWLPTETTAGEVTLEKCWALHYESTELPIDQTSYVATRTGEVRYTEVHGAFADFSGEVTADLKPQCFDDTDPITLDPFDSRWHTDENLPMQHLNVVLNGTQTVTTDIDGDWSGTDSPSSVSVDITMNGPIIGTLTNEDGSGGIDYSGTAQDGVLLETDLSDPVGTQAELVVWAASNHMWTIFQDIDPDFSIVDGSWPIDVTVEIDELDPSCDGFLAHAGPNHMDFCEAKGQWNSSATVAHIVYHEFGHVVAFREGRSNGENGLSEGAADLWSAQILHEPRLSRGAVANNCVSYPRACDVRKSYPADYDPDPDENYNVGLILGSFYWFVGEKFRDTESDWDARAKTLRLYHVGGFLVEPRTYEQEALAIFIADDSDGNLLNGTPNYDALYCEAICHFPASYIPSRIEGAPNCPSGNCNAPVSGPTVAHTPIGITDDGGPHRVEATVLPTERPLDEDDVFLVYRIDDGDTEVVRMDPEGTNKYVALIPETTVMSEATYYISAADNRGTVGTSPETAPASLHRLRAASTLEDFEDLAPHWTTNVDELDSATDGAWVLVDPTATSAQPGDDVTRDPGAHCWVTGNGALNENANESDLDGGTTTLCSPAYDLSGSQSAEVEFSWWFSSDGGGFDELVMQARNNEGPWVRLATFDGSALEWNRVQLDLQSGLGEALGNVEFRFLATDGADDSLVEAAVDDFALFVEYSPANVEEVGTPLQEYLAIGSKNPSQGPVSFRFGLKNARSVELRVYDVHGRLVRRIDEGLKAPGHHMTEWDGRNQLGEPVHSGAYYVRFQGETEQSRRVLILR